MHMSLYKYQVEKSCLSYPPMMIHRQMSSFIAVFLTLLSIQVTAVSIHRRTLNGPSVQMGSTTVVGRIKTPFMSTDELEFFGGMQ